MQRLHLTTIPTNLRNIPFIRLGAIQNIAKKIVDEDGDPGRIQTSFGGLLEYTDNLLEEYYLGAYMSIERGSKNLLYNVYEGKDRSVGNVAGNAPLIFSQDFDNLMNSDYKYETTALKTTALIGGEGEGADRFCTMVGGYASGLDRREVFVNASSQSRTYKVEAVDEETGETVEVDKIYTEAEYDVLLKAHGQQALAPLQTVQTFTGEVDVQNSDKAWGVDYWLGDIITIQDIQLGTYINTRILKATEVQDSGGYKLSISYGA